MELKKRSVQSETEGMAERLSIGLWGKDEFLFPRTNVITDRLISLLWGGGRE